MLGKRGLGLRYLVVTHKFSFFANLVEKSLLMDRIF